MEEGPSSPISSCGGMQPIRLRKTERKRERNNLIHLSSPAFRSPNNQWKPVVRGDQEMWFTVVSLPGAQGRQRVYLRKQKGQRLAHKDFKKYLLPNLGEIKMCEQYKHSQVAERKLQAILQDKKKRKTSLPLVPVICGYTGISNQKIRLFHIACYALRWFLIYHFSGRTSCYSGEK